MEETIITKPRISVPKTIAKLIVGRSVSGVIVTALHNNCPVDTKIAKIQVYIGAYVCGAIVADKAVNWASDRYDEIADVVDEVKAKISEKKEAPAE